MLNDGRMCSMNLKCEAMTLRTGQYINLFTSLNFVAKPLTAVIVPTSILGPSILQFIPVFFTLRKSLNNVKGLFIIANVCGKYSPVSEVFRLLCFCHYSR